MPCLTELTLIPISRYIMHIRVASQWRYFCLPSLSYQEIPSLLPSLPSFLPPSFPRFLSSSFLMRKTFLMSPIYVDATGPRTTLRPHVSDILNEPVNYLGVSVHFSSVATTLWDPMDCSRPVFPIHHYLLCWFQFQEWFLHIVPRMAISQSRSVSHEVIKFQWITELLLPKRNHRSPEFNFVSLAFTASSLNELCGWGYAIISF